MRYKDAISRARLYPDEAENEKFAPTCTECGYSFGYGHAQLQPLHVDDRSGVHFLICPSCGEVYYRPQWYETPEEKTIRALMERIARLEERITALEAQKQRPTPQRTPPKREEDESSIMLPNLFTV